jgi:hypothetical protein
MTVKTDAASYITATQPHAEAAFTGLSSARPRLARHVPDVNDPERASSNTIEDLIAIADQQPDADTGPLTDRAAKLRRTRYVLDQIANSGGDPLPYGRVGGLRVIRSDLTQV